MSQENRISGQILKIIVFFILTAVFIPTGFIMVKNFGILYEVLIFEVGVNTLKHYYPDATGFAVRYILEIINLFLKSYAFPVYLMILPASAAGIWLIYRFPILKKEKRDENSLRELESCKYAWIVAVVGFILVFVIFYFPMKNFVKPHDPFSYVFQAKVLIKGKLFVESPRYPEFYTTPHIINNGRWYSKYTIGWPLLLIPGVVLGIPQLTCAFCTFGALILLCFIYKKHFGQRGSLLAPIITLLCPMVIFTNSTLFSHAGALFFALLAVYFFLEYLEEKKLTKAVIASAALVVLFQIRPVDGFLFAGSVFLFVMIGVIRKNYTREKLLALTAYLTAAGLVSGILLGIVNYIQNGNPFLFSFLVYNPDDKLGFGVFGHTPLFGIWNTLYSIFRIMTWSFPLLLEFSLAALFIDKNHKLKLPWVMFLVYTVFFFIFYSEGGFSYGQRYFIIPVVLLTLSAMRGIIRVDELIRNRFSPASLTPALGALIVMVLTVIYPFAWSKVEKHCSKKRLTYNLIEKAVPANQKSVVFLTSGALVNSPDLKKERIITVYLLKPEKNAKLKEIYPDRKHYILLKDLSDGSYNVIPYPWKKLDRGTLGLLYYYAAENYMYRLTDGENARECFKKAVKYLPQNPWAWYKYGLLEFLGKNYSRSQEIFKQFVERFPPKVSMLGYYYLGRIAGENGDHHKAVKLLDKFMEFGLTGTPFYDQAEAWKKYYRSKIENRDDKKL